MFIAKGEGSGKDTETRDEQQSATATPSATEPERKVRPRESSFAYTLPSGRDHSDPFCPAILPSQRPSFQRLTALRLSSWLADPLRLYSRSRMAQKGP